GPDPYSGVACRSWDLFRTGTEGCFPVRFDIPPLIPCAGPRRSHRDRYRHPSQRASGPLGEGRRLLVESPVPFHHALRGFVRSSNSRRLTKTMSDRETGSERITPTRDETVGGQ